MQRIKYYLLFLMVSVTLHCTGFGKEFPNDAYALNIDDSATIQVYRSLSPEQRSALEREIKDKDGLSTTETGGVLTKRPEFNGLTPEDIRRGKDVLEKREVRDGRDKKQKSRKPDEEGKRIKSLFDRYRTRESYQDISTDLRPFGYEFFSKLDGRSFLPLKNIPASSDYIIGPGDEVKIMLWGRVNARYELVVDRDGNISIPQIGPLQVSGMRFDEMKTFLSEQADQIVGANINVTLGSLKSIQIFVLGEVKNPGSYALDSFSTMTSALLAAGGPTEIGSLRGIVLKRKKTTVMEMDFYDFLLTGDRSQDRVLQSGDVVFVTTAGPLVGVAGNVRRPAIYELKEESDLLSLLSMAGDVLPSAYTLQIQVERIQKNERHVVIDINDRDLAASKDFMLKDGDLVKVFSIVDKDMNAVYLEGNVKRPGKYAYKPGMRVRDLISDQSDLLEETYFEYAFIKRRTPPDFNTQVIPFKLGKLLFNNDREHDLELQPLDSLHIFSLWFFQDKPIVTVEGEVREEGDFDLLRNYRVKDAIMEAGGLTKDASWGKGEIFRINEKGDVSQLYFSVSRVMDEDPKENVLLLDRDRIIIHSLWEQKYKRVVFIDGNIQYPGEYPLAENMRVSDLVFSAGNLLESAFLDEAEISSFIIEDGKSIEIEYRKINLGLAIENDPAHNIVLHPDDRVFVRGIPEWKEERFVSVSGEVVFQGNYIVKKGETLSSVIQRAGGYTENAYLRGAVFTRDNVRELEQKSLNAMIMRLEREILIEGSKEVSAALSGEEVEAKKVESQHKQKFIESLKELKATGRMSIKLAHMRLLKGSKYDIKLEDGDSLYIPMKSSVVNVVGAVMSKGSFIYSEELDYKNYIEMAGGYMRFADIPNIYVLKVDGTARKLATGLFNWNNAHDRWEVTAFGEEVKEIEPGDTIVVPEKLDRIAWLRELKDISQILYQIAVTAGVAIVIF